MKTAGEYRQGKLIRFMIHTRGIEWERSEQRRRDCTDYYQQQCLLWMICGDGNNPFFDSEIT